MNDKTMLKHLMNALGSDVKVDSVFFEKAEKWLERQQKSKHCVHGPPYTMDTNFCTYCESCELLAKQVREKKNIALLDFCR